MVINEFGQGTSIYFANEINHLNYTIGHPDYDQLLQNSINHLIDSTSILITNAPASVHVYLNKSSENPNVFMLSLVNTSGNTQRPIRTLVPVTDILIKLPFEISAMETIYPSSVNNMAFQKSEISIEYLEEFCSLKILAHLSGH
jgi:hypothetical protein